MSFGSVLGGAHTFLLGKRNKALEITGQNDRYEPSSLLSVVSSAKERPVLTLVQFLKLFFRALIFILSFYFLFEFEICRLIFQLWVKRSRKYRVLV